MKTFIPLHERVSKNSAISKTSNTLKSLMICTLLLLASKAMAQTTHIVNSNPGTDADFTNLQAAIDAANDGDIIHVQQSATTYGSITLNKGLTIIGRSHSDAFYKSVVGDINITEGASNVIIKGLKTENIIASGPDGLTINNVSVYDCDITMLNLTSSENVVIKGNIIRTNITITSNNSNILITNNIISANILFFMVDTLLFSNNIINTRNGQSIGNATTGLLNISNSIFVRSGDSFPIGLASSSGSIQVFNCISYNYNADETLNFPTANNITLINVQENVDPLFTNRDGGNSTGTLADPTNGPFIPGVDDLTLQASSPVIDAGLYEGYNFKPLGTPTGLPSIKIDNYSPTVPKNGDLNVTITAKTN